MAARRYHREDRGRQREPILLFTAFPPCSLRTPICVPGTTVGRWDVGFAIHFCVCVCVRVRVLSPYMEEEGR